MAINGIIGILGGVVNVEVGKTFQLTPAIVYDYVLSFEAQPTKFVYESSDTANVTVSPNSGLVTGVIVDTTAQITITYTDEDSNTYKDIIDVFVRPEGWLPPDPSVVTDTATPENILKGKIATVNGVHIVGTADCYVDEHTLYMPEGLISVES